jgi:hypothetical protein
VRSQAKVGSTTHRLGRLGSKRFAGGLTDFGLK